MSLDQRLIAIGTLIAVLSAALVGTRLARDERRPPVPAVSRTVALGADGKLSVLWLGDTMLGDAAQPLVNQHGYGWPLERVAPLLGADFVFANSDSPITTLTEPWDRSKTDSYQMHPLAAVALARAGVDAISLANDHAMDRGPIGLTETLTNAERAGLTAIGAGDTVERAQQPLVLRSAAGTVGVVAFTEYAGRDSQAGRSRPGAMALDVEAIETGLARARAAGAGPVVAYVDWGDAYDTVNARQRYWAQRLASAGYAMVVGTGPHVAQPIDFVNGVPIVYSLGNFVFGTPGRFARSGKPGVGLLVTTDFDRSSPVTLTVRCISTDNAAVYYQPAPCSPEQEQAVLPTLHRQVVMRDHAAVISAVVPQPSPPVHRP